MYRLQAIAVNSSALQLLLPPSCVASCDPTHEAPLAPIAATVPSVPPRNPFEGVTAPATTVGNPFELPSMVAPMPPAASIPVTRPQSASSLLFAGIKSALHASALRSILVGRTSESSGGVTADGILPGSSASAGVHPGGMSVSLIAVALDVISQVIYFAFSAPSSPRTATHALS